MFCPHCRRHWKVDELPPSPWRGAGRAQVCPFCHIPLAPERLADEFPLVEPAWATSASLTVRDVLRETAQNSPLSPQIPLDDQMQRLRKSGWQHEPDNVSTTSFYWLALSHWKRRLVEILLGLAALAALLLTLAGAVVSTKRQDAYARTAPMAGDIRARDVGAAHWQEKAYPTATTR